MQYKLPLNNESNPISLIGIKVQSKVLSRVSVCAYTQQC